MIILYILGGIVLLFVVLYILLVVFINVRRRRLISKVYDGVNEFVNTKDFISESNYIGGDIEKKWVYSTSISDDNFLNPKEIFISSLKLPRKKARYNSMTYTLACLLEKRDGKWVVVSHEDMEKEMMNALAEEHGVKIKRKKY